jgi:hypothetical protein
MAITCEHNGIKYWVRTNRDGAARWHLHPPIVDRVSRDVVEGDAPNERAAMLAAQKAIEGRAHVGG